MSEELAALEARSDKPAEPVKDPEMTMEHKAQVLLHQRQQLTLQLTIHKLQQQLDSMPGQMNALLNKVCKELGIDPAKFTFDLDNLKIATKDK